MSKFCRCCGFLPCRGAPAEVEASWGDAQEVREAHLEPTYVSPYSAPTARARMLHLEYNRGPRDWGYGYGPIEASFRTLRADRCPLVSDSCPREDHVHDPNNGGWVPLHPGEGFRVFAIFEPVQPPAPRIVGCIGCGAVAQRCNPLCPAQGAARMPEDPYAATASQILERQRAMEIDGPIPEAALREILGDAPEPFSVQIRADTRRFQVDFAAVERRLAAMMGCGSELATLAEREARTAEAVLRPSWSELETRIAATLRETADLHSGCEDAPNGEDSP